MRVMICIPQPADRSEAFPLEVWSLIHDLGFDGVRTDVRREGDAGALVANVTAAGRDGLLIAPVDVRDIDETLAVVEAIAIATKVSRAPELVSLEVGNEPDRSGRWRNDPAGFGRLVAAAAEVAWAQLPDLQVVSGGIATLSREALDWLSLAAPHMPRDVAIGYHPYRQTAPGIPRKGFASRAAEFAALRRIAGPRSLWNTEIGWHTAPRPNGFPLCFTKTARSETEVAAYLREELRLNERAGAEVVCVYQLNSGPAWRTESEDAFGVRRFDGSLRPAAYVAREWRS